MMRVAETKLGFTRSPAAPHLQYVCEDTKVKVEVKLLPVMVTAVPPVGGPPPGSIFVTLQGANCRAWLPVIHTTCKSKRQPPTLGINDGNEVERLAALALAWRQHLEASCSAQIMTAASRAVKTIRATG